MYSQDALIGFCILCFFGGGVIFSLVTRIYLSNRNKPFLEILSLLASAKDWSQLDSSQLLRVSKAFEAEFKKLAEPRNNAGTTPSEEAYQNQHQRLSELSAALAMCTAEVARKEAVVGAKELYAEMLEADYDPNELHHLGQRLQRLLSQRFTTGDGGHSYILPFITLRELGHHHDRFGEFYAECVKDMLKKEPIRGGISASTG
jgi:hypothetical protein